MSWPLAITQEVPDCRGDHVLLTHPMTWLRDLDPFARTVYPMLTAEKARDEHLWPGQRLSRCVPCYHVAVELALDEMSRPRVLVPRRHGKAEAIRIMNEMLGQRRFIIPRWPPNPARES